MRGFFGKYILPIIGIQFVFNGLIRVAEANKGADVFWRVIEILCGIFLMLLSLRLWAEEDRGSRSRVQREGNRPRRGMSALRFLFEKKKREIRGRMLWYIARKCGEELRMLVNDPVLCEDPLTCRVEDGAHLGCFKVQRVIHEIYNCEEGFGRGSKPLIPPRLQPLVRRILAAETREEVLAIPFNYEEG